MEGSKEGLDAAAPDNTTRTHNEEKSRGGRAVEGEPWRWGRSWGEKNAMCVG